LTLTGCVISPRRTISGGGGGGGTANGRLYVSNDANNSIVRFDNAFTANGNVTPGGIISGASTQLSNPQYIFLDASADRLFVANANASNILIFDNASTLNGNIAPTRAITSASLATPTDVALDKGRDLLYVADNNQILVFASASTVNGLTTPVRSIQPGFTAGAIFIDAADDRLFAADPATNSINVFDGASTLNGTVSVNRRVVGADTQLAQPFGLQIDSAGRLVVANFAPASITIYTNAAAATGDQAPAAVISGSNTNLAGPTQMTINTVASAGELFVADPFGGNVAVFGSLGTLTGNQNIAPLRNITGPNTTISGTTSATARGVAIDTTR
jgi:6-phosphogluconolactonase (cycloisomerase 2 family)